MDSFLFPLIPNESHLVTATPKSGTNPSGDSLTQDPRREGAFLDVLGSSQTAIEQRTILLHEFNDDSVLRLAAFTNDDQLDETIPYVSSFVDTTKVVFGQTDAELTTSHALAQNPVNANLFQDLVPDVLNANRGAQSSVRLAQATLASQHALLNVGEELRASIPQEIVRGTPEPRTLSPVTAFLNSLNEESEEVARPFKASSPEQSAGNSEARLQPLVNQPVRPGVPVPSVTGAVDATPLGIETKAQQVLSQFEVQHHLKSDIGIHSLQGSLSQTREEPSVSLTRLDGDAKSSGTIGISSGGETGLANGGNGLTFGNQAGQTLGQLLDSSPGTSNSTGLAQGNIRAGNFDERLQLLSHSMPQRLQIDVQLSETARVQVDVGVQQRQVYAGMLLDNPVLRSLAVHNVQDLQNQLAQAEMELEEFDVYEEEHNFGEQASSDNTTGKNVFGKIVEQLEYSSTQQGQAESRRIMNQERGLHFVA